MADTHEEQLLSELLRNIAHDDERLEAAHLEPRVMATLDLAPAPRFRPRATHIVIAAAAVIAILIPGMTWVIRDNPPAVSEARVQPPQPVTTDTPAISPKPSTHARPATPRGPSRTTTHLKPMRDARASVSDGSMAPSPRTPIAESRVPESDVFVPLMPMTEQELAGSFKLVRVQMPRASLGALRSPLDHPNELIEADVLLGEDGMARAIRVSTSGSIYPWRSR